MSCTCSLAPFEAACGGEPPHLLDVGAVRRQRRFIDAHPIDALVAHLHFGLLALALRRLVDRVDDALAYLPRLGLEEHADDGIVFVFRELEHDAAEVRAAAAVLLLELDDYLGREAAGRAVDAHDLADRTLCGRDVDGAEVEVARQVVRDGTAYRLRTHRRSTPPIFVVTRARRGRGSGCNGHVVDRLCGRRDTWSKISPRGEVVSARLENFFGGKSVTRGAAGNAP